MRHPKRTKAADAIQTVIKIFNPRGEPQQQDADQDQDDAQDAADFSGGDGGTDV